MAKGTLFGKPRSQVVKRPGALRAAAKRRGAMTKGGKINLGKMSKAAAKSGNTRLKRQVALAKAFRTMRKG